MLRDFRDFILRGSLVDLAVGVVIGVAFGNLVTALVSDLITPLIAAVGGRPRFSDLSFTVNGSHFLYGAFVDALLSFLVIAAVVFFLVIRPVNALMARRRTEPETGQATRACPHCLSQIPEAASRCAFCTADLEPAGAT